MYPVAASKNTYISALDSTPIITEEDFITSGVILSEVIEGTALATVTKGLVVAFASVEVDSNNKITGYNKKRYNGYLFR